MIAPAAATKPRARKCNYCSPRVSLCSNPGLNTITSWQPKIACRPGNRSRHSSSRFSAAFESGSNSRGCGWALTRSARASVGRPADATAASADSRLAPRLVYRALPALALPGDSECLI
jgi:hypothetical protein